MELTLYWCLIVTKLKPKTYVISPFQTMGVPIALEIKIQVNLAVRTSPGNPITKPFKDKVLPLIWLSMVSHSYYL